MRSPMPVAVALMAALGSLPGAAAAPVIKYSHAVGNTHDCSSYYPVASQSNSETGDVLVGYDVGADGAISNVHLIESSGTTRLDDAALACVREAWRNTPATLDGVPANSPGYQAIIRFYTGNAMTAEDLFQRAQAMETLGKHGLAIGLFSQALAIRSNYPAAYRARARVYEEVGQHAFAASDTAKADTLEKPR